VKPRFDIDVVIIGFAETLQEDKIEGEDAISSLLVAVLREDGSYQEMSHVGGGFTQEQRVEFYTLLKNDIVESDYKASTTDGRAYHFVRPKYVIQIIYSDILTEGASGLPIHKMNLKFENNRWTTLRTTPFVALVSPSYELLRSEVDISLYPSLEFANIKMPTCGDVNINQITNIVEVESPDTIEAIPPLPKITMLLRVVFKVKWGGVESAKKILLWATNKHEIDPSYPNYVVYSADYSFTRSEPLQQEIYPFNSLQKALEHLNFLFMRPDNPSEGFLDSKNTGLKRSLVLPPYSIEIHKTIENDLAENLNNQIKSIIIV
jgi:hypothetical protein